MLLSTLLILLDYLINFDNTDIIDYPGFDNIAVDPFPPQLPDRGWVIEVVDYSTGFIIAVFYQHLHA